MRPLIDRSVRWAMLSAAAAHGLVLALATLAPLPADARGVAIDDWKEANVWSSGCMISFAPRSHTTLPPPPAFDPWSLPWQG